MTQRLWQITAGEKDIKQQRTQAKKKKKAIVAEIAAMPRVEKIYCETSSSSPVILVELN